MKKLFTVLLAIGFLATTSAVVAAKQTGKTPTRTKSSERIAKRAGKTNALVTLDYFDTASSAFYLWGGNFYMSNLFVPAPGSYPLQVLSFDVYYTALDGQTTAGTGNINGVRVFDTTGVVLGGELGVTGNIDSWTNVTLTTPPTIASGNFYGGLWNSVDTSTNPDTQIDAGLQGSAMNWSGPPDEPFAALNGASAAAAGPFTVTTPGTAYGTISAASIVANINTNVPVELMRFVAE